MKKASMLVAMVVLVAAAWSGVAEASPAVPDKHIDLVICLDTSGSMRGLIESAKQKLWAVVNELATAKPRPDLRVALYHYGNSGLKSSTGWVEQLCPLTDDLDSVYAKLFPLRTNGGTELVARVVKAACDELEWNKDKDTLRMDGVAKRRAVDTGLPLAYLHRVGGQDELVFDGGAWLADGSGHVHPMARSFSEGWRVADFHARTRGFEPVHWEAETDASAHAQLWRALVCGTRDYLRKNGFNRAICSSVNQKRLLMITPVSSGA